MDFTRDSERQILQDPVRKLVGGTLPEAFIAIQAVASVCSISADAVQACSFAAIRPPAEYASAAQMERYLQRLLKGEKRVDLGMTEPDTFPVYLRLVPGTGGISQVGQQHRGFRGLQPRHAGKRRHEIFRRILRGILFPQVARMA